MNDPKTRINNRWTRFCFAACLDSTIEPDIIAYSNYIDWMIDNYHPRLILKICADLTCQHIKLYKNNPMDNKILRLRMMTIKYFGKTDRKTDCHILIN